MRHTTITARDLECLEHMRNVGQLVNADAGAGLRHRSS
jgi:hypothetical protein